MRALIGCSASLAFVAFAIGLIASLLFARDATWPESLGMASMAAGMAFFAALLLAVRDNYGYRTTAKVVRNNLSKGPDISDDEFLACKSSTNTELLLETRLAVSKFYDVPKSKIARDLHLLDDLQVHKFEPGFQFSVVGSIVSSCVDGKRMYPFSMSGITSLDDLADAIQKVLDDMICQ